MFDVSTGAPFVGPSCAVHIFASRERPDPRQHQSQETEAKDPSPRGILFNRFLIDVPYHCRNRVALTVEIVSDDERREMKSTVILVAVLLCGTALLVVGCPRTRDTDSSGDPEGWAAVEHESADGSESAEGQASGDASSQESGAFTDLPDEISVYPGAIQLGGGRETTVTGLRVSGTIDGSTYHVDAAYDEVAAWYRNQLTGERELSATISSERGSGRGTIFVLLSGTGAGAAVTVASADDGPGTTINIGSWNGSID